MEAKKRVESVAVFKSHCSDQIDKRAKNEIEKIILSSLKFILINHLSDII